MLYAKQKIKYKIKNYVTARANCLVKKTLYFHKATVCVKI